MIRLFLNLIILFYGVNAFSQDYTFDFLPTKEEVKQKHIKFIRKFEGMDRIDSVCDPGSLNYVLHYDTSGNLISRIYYEPHVIVATSLCYKYPVNIETFTYDHQGRELGHEYKVEYNATFVQDKIPMKQSKSTYHWDEKGNQKGVLIDYDSDKEGKDSSIYELYTEFGKDKQPLKTIIVDKKDTTMYTYQYNKAGNLIGKKTYYSEDSTEFFTFYEYDSLGNFTGEKTKWTLSERYSKQTAYKYNDKGEILASLSTGNIYYFPGSEGLPYTNLTYYNSNSQIDRKLIFYSYNTCIDTLIQKDFKQTAQSIFSGEIDLSVYVGKRSSPSDTFYNDKPFIEPQHKEGYYRCPGELLKYQYDRNGNIKRIGNQTFAYEYYETPQFPDEYYERQNCTTFYKDGTKRSEMKMEYGTGKVTKYFSNGNPASETEYKNYFPEGKFIEYYKNGSKEIEAELKEGDNYGEILYYREDGTLKKRNNWIKWWPIGHQYEYYPNGKIKEYLYLNHWKAHDGHHESPGDSSIFFFYYENGELAFKEIYTNRSTYVFYLKALNGRVLIRDGNGRICLEDTNTSALSFLTFLQDEDWSPSIDGDTVEEYENVDPTFRFYEGRFRKGLPVGFWITCYSNGNKCSEGMYVKGDKRGRWTYYNPAGKMVHQEYYKIESRENYNRRLRGRHRD